MVLEYRQPSTTAQHTYSLYTLWPSNTPYNLSTVQPTVQNPRSIYKSTMIWKLTHKNINITFVIMSLYCIKTCFFVWNLAALYSHPNVHDFVFAGLVVMAILKTWRGMTASLSIVESCHYEFSTMCKSLVTAGRIVGALLITSTASWTWRKANVHFSYKLAKE